ncbi:hypothetical protein OIU84_017808 [Salix udensis]|uniref:Uncharacterized protein n=1 Tax=Salix udensis TaxID=889485 RepID=A0AAD6L4A8_9ROSI|nr:hypothetical protein OIU84_017808 [Salix udensis]
MLLLLVDVVAQDDDDDAINLGGIAILAGKKDPRVGKASLVELDRSELRKYSDGANKSRRGLKGKAKVVVGMLSL